MGQAKILPKNMGRILQESQACLLAGLIVYPKKYKGNIAEDVKHCSGMIKCMCAAMELFLSFCHQQTQGFTVAMYSSKLSNF